MSDPAKSADEIEDVLASIRRLVSESGAPAPRPAMPDKLVLTPAQRVSEPDDPWAPVTPAPAATADAEPGEEEDGDPAWGLEDRLSDWGEIEDSGDEAVADAMAEDAADPAPLGARRAAADSGLDLHGRAERDGGVALDAEVVEAFEPETGDADWPGRGAESALRSLAAVRFGQGAPTGVGHAEVESPASLTDLATPEEAPMVETADDAGDPPDTPPTQEPVPEPETAMTEGPADRPAERSSPDPTITQVFSRRADPVTSPAMQDAEAADEDEIEDDIEDLGEAPSPFTFPDAEEGLLDEETLREIVAEVVRAELQGVLGQRITRNVRKMVRREIRIALAAEDLE
jgi:hypothetical protein